LGNRRSFGGTASPWRPTGHVVSGLRVFEELLDADSKGGYFNRNIRNRFPYKRLA
jgi:hypothetical protein